MSDLRSRKLGDEIKSGISAIIPTLKDPRIRGIVSVTRVDVSGDGKYAKIFISVLGDEAELKECMKGFASSAGFIRRELAASLSLRHTPELAFEADRGILRGMRIIGIMDELEKNKPGEQ